MKSDLLERIKAVSPRCTAKNRQGNRCGKPPIPGGTVCHMHGGGAPQVRQAARLRLAALVDPAINVLASLLKPSKRKIPENVRLAAAKDALDRNGLKPKDEVVLSHEFDPSQFSHMTDEEVATLLKLARKASTLRDVHDKSE